MKKFTDINIENYREVIKSRLIENGTIENEIEEQIEIELFKLTNFFNGLEEHIGDNEILRNKVWKDLELKGIV